VSDYESLRTGRGTVAGLHGLIWVTGADAVVFLDSLLSQNVAGIAEGAVARSLLLAPNGKLRAALWVLRDADRIGLMCDAGRVDAVIGDLSRFRIRVDADIVADHRPVWDVLGPETDLVVPSPPRAWTDDGATLIADVPFAHSPLPRRVVAGSQPSADLVDVAAVTAVRIEVGEPVVGVDLDDRTIPQETGDVAAAVDFTKGCYLGQELVARIDSRGHVNRRLAGLIFTSPDSPPVGSAILHEGNEIGLLTSVAYSAGLAAPVGLALVRNAVDDNAQIVVDGRHGRLASVPIRA